MKDKLIEIMCHVYVCVWAHCYLNTNMSACSIAFTSYRIPIRYVIGYSPMFIIQETSREIFNNIPKSGK